MSKASKNGGIKGLPVGKSFLTIPFRSRKNAPFLEYFALKEAKVHVSWGSFQDNIERKTYILQGYTVQNILCIIFSCMKSEVIAFFIGSGASSNP